MANCVNGLFRRIIVPEAVSAFLAEQVRNKLPAAPMFMRRGGARWTRDNWNDPIKSASISAGLGPAVTAYTFRHSVITDLVNGGLALLTVAQMSDNQCRDDRTTLRRPQSRGQMQRSHNLGRPLWQIQYF